VVFYLVFLFLVFAALIMAFMVWSSSSCSAAMVLAFLAFLLCEIIAFYFMFKEVFLWLVY
jgi:hypothetical protein